jgi:hypothetical protein
MLDCLKTSELDDNGLAGETELDQVRITNEDPSRLS